MSIEKRLTRSRTNRMLGGVCGGLGEYFNIDPTVIRLVFVSLFFLGAGFPVLGYLLLWIIIPPTPKVAGHLPVTQPEPEQATVLAAETESEPATTPEIADETETREPVAG